MTAIADDFNRANGALGANWASGLNSAAETIVSNAVVGANDAVDHISIWQGTALGANQSSRTTIITLATNNQYCRVGVRMSGSAGTLQGYGFYTDGTTGATHTEIDSWTAGSQSVEASIATTFTAADIMELRVTGVSPSVSLQPYKNGSPIGSPITPTAQFNTGQPAIGDFNGGSFDTFSAEDDLAVATTPSGPGLPRTFIRRPRPFAPGNPR